MEKKCTAVFVFFLFLILTPQNIVAQEGQVKIIVGKANILLKPDINSLIVGSASQGSVLKTVAKEGEWFRISMPPDEKGMEIMGYVHQSLVEVIIPVVSKESAPPDRPEHESPKTGVMKETEIEPQSSPSRRQSGLETGFRFYGAGDFLIFGRNDINRHLQGLNDRMIDTAYLLPGEIGGDIEEIKTGIEFGGEFFVRFSPYLGIGLGAGYIKTGEKESEMSYQQFSPSLSEQLMLTPQITAIPVLLTFYVSIPIGNIVDIVGHAGGGLYLGSIQFNQTLHVEHSGAWLQTDINWEAKSSAAGFHGGLGIDFHLNRIIDLVLGVSARTIHFTDLRADANFRFSTSITPDLESTEYDQTLWYHEMQSAGIWYPEVILGDSAPIDSFSRNSEKAVVGLSGLSLSIGLKIKLNSQIGQ